MRRPSTEQNKDDLNRLTASASVRSSESVNSNQTAINTINQNNHHHNDSNNNKNNSSSNYLPNIIIANAELQQQCRKRKDRQDSTSSITQDRKVVRSSSEENVPNCQDQNDAIRRVSSHESFNDQKPQQNNESEDNGSELKLATVEEHTSVGVCRVVVSSDDNCEIKTQSSGDLTTAPNSVIDVSTTQNTRVSLSNNLSDDFMGDENEKRRHSERFLKTKSPSGRKSPRRPRKTSPIVFKEVDENVQDKKESKEESIEDDEMPNSPVLSKTLYPWESADDKPIVCQRFAENTFDHVHHSISKFIKHDHDLVKFNYAPDDEDEKKHYRSSNFMNIENIKTREIHQKSHSPLSSAGIYQTPDERIRQINKRLTSLKKKISHYEENFESSYGYRPSHADKSSDKNIKNYIAEIHKLRKEKSQVKTDPITAMGYKNKFDDNSIPVEKKLSKLKESLQDIEKKLQEKRVEEQRPALIEEMTPDQLVDEKSSIQRALLYFESMFGRPGTSEERDAARPLYDRYRLLKRLVNRNNSISGLIPELPTILENEALALSGSGIVTPSTDFSPPSAHSAIQSPSDSSTSTSIDANVLSGQVTTTFQENFQLHAMSVKELYGHFDSVREEKKQLRRTIKEFEHNFEELNGRKMLKSDRTVIDDTYTLYKEKKAKLRLLDALVKKQMSA